MSTEHNARYGSAHRRLRRQWARLVATGGQPCARCGKLIVPGELWDLDHVDGAGPGEYLGPSHRRCNRAVLTHRKAREAEATLPRFRTSRHWWSDDDRRRGCPCHVCVAHFAAGGEEVIT